jgi:hypothetical protein
VLHTVLGGVLYSHKNDKTQQTSSGTIVTNSDAMATVTLYATDGDIQLLGSSVRTPGRFAEIAPNGRVLHADRILTTTGEHTCVR